MNRLRNILNDKSGLTIMNVLVSFLIVIVSITMFYSAIMISNNMSLAADELRKKSEAATVAYYKRDSTAVEEVKTYRVKFINELSSQSRFEFDIVFRKTVVEDANRYYFFNIN